MAEGKAIEIGVGRGQGDRIFAKHHHLLREHLLFTTKTTCCITPCRPLDTTVMPDPKMLECFENPNPKRDYVIEHVADEFTSVCPKTGHPDFGTVTVRYVPKTQCVELKSLKLYYQGFRNEGIFYEAVTNRIADDLAGAMGPRWMVVTTDWRGRGGIRSRVRVEVGEVPGHERVR